MYISVIGLGVFYTLTSWASLAGYPSVNSAIASAQGDPANFFFTPSTQYAGHWVTSVMSYLIITGSFACGMAFHNTTARYTYSLGREGMLPPVLGKTHPRWQSPHIASIASSVVSLFIVGLFAIFVGTNDPGSQAYGQLYGLMAVMGVIIILSVQALVSLAILVYYLRHHRDEVHWWTTLLAPVLAFVSQGYVVYLLFENLNFLGAGSYGYAKLFGPIDLAVVLIGIALGFYYKKKHPAKYEQIGRLVNEGL
jgi:amino acid transporter